jgi:hypothetical protein
VVYVRLLYLAGKVVFGIMSYLEQGKAARAAESLKVRNGVGKEDAFTPSSKNGGKGYDQTKRRYTGRDESRPQGAYSDARWGLGETGRDKKKTRFRDVLYKP